MEKGIYHIILKGEDGHTNSFQKFVKNPSIDGLWNFIEKSLSESVSERKQTYIVYDFKMIKE